MSITVGLDFGTHQTKVCIEDASNPTQKTYEFLEFQDNSGGASVLFPSIVQVNDDETVSYGFVDTKRCKITVSPESTKPELKELAEPALILPEKPIKPQSIKKPKTKKQTGLSMKEQLELLAKHSKLTNDQEGQELEGWEIENIKKDKEYIENCKAWEEEKNKLEGIYNNELDKYVKKSQALRKQYEIELSEWNKSRVENMRYRYFKLASFSNSFKWKHKAISSDIISIWYLAYVLFTIQEKYGEDFFVQIGVPSGINRTMFDGQKRKAFSILISAYKLVEYFAGRTEFLNESYTNLLEITEVIEDFSKDDLRFYGLNALPEAYAGLSAITQNQRIEHGISLLIDIGGGTTDIAIFTIKDGQPDIHEVISFPKGLNFIFEEFIKNNSSLDLENVQELFSEFEENGKEFDLGIKNYHAQLIEKVKKMIKRLRLSFLARREVHRLPLTRLEIALKGRPIVFCGGGSMYSDMRTRIASFTDIKLMNKGLLNIPIVINEHIESHLYAILATSFGLSIPKEDEIHLTPVSEVFDHLEGIEESASGNDYEHGLTDM